MFSDSICVQSWDSKFWVFEQEHFSFSTDWNNFLIPWCITQWFNYYNDCSNVRNSEEKQNDESGRRNGKSFHKNWYVNLCDHGTFME